jgi:polysaccharide biosynthesis/export protein
MRRLCVAYDWIFPMTEQLSPPRLSDRLRSSLGAILLGASALALSGCGSLGSAGPSTGAIKKSGGQVISGSEIQVIELDDRSMSRIMAASQVQSFADVFGDAPQAGTIIGRGDVLDIAIWEAPPAVLFGTTSIDPRGGPIGALAQTTTLPSQMVGDEGTVMVPFAGAIRVAGMTTAQVQREIVRRLTGRAHSPQAVVRLVQNETRNVTVLGDVAGSRRVPLSAKGERLLDIVAAAGGPRNPVGKTTVQIARGTTVATMALDRVIRDPVQNVVVRPDDVITVLFQPFSFTALGAVTQNAEIPFEGSGLTLAQALGRVGGLRDERADARGVFVFRLEDPLALDPGVAATARKTNEGKVPVIYRLKFSDPASFFTAQNFAIRNGDVIYVSNAPGADLQKFLTALSNVALSTIAITNAIR